MSGIFPPRFEMLQNISWLYYWQSIDLVDFS